METTRAKISHIAAALDVCDRDLRALPQSPTAYQALARLAETSGLVRVLHAKTAEPAPRLRVKKRLIP